MKHQPNARRVRRTPVSVEDVTPITPVAKWGRDHWSTLLYVESRCVDYKGEIANERMRTHPRVHRKLLGDAQALYGIGGDYPTVLRNGDTIDRHDDWSCLEEMVAHGLVVVVGERDRRPSQHFTGGEVTVRLTDLGWRVAHRIRRDRAEGTPTATWAPSPELEAEIKFAFSVLSGATQEGEGTP